MRSLQAVQVDLVQLPEDPRLRSERGRAQYERDRLEWEEEKQKNKVRHWCFSNACSCAFDMGLWR